MKFLPNYLHPLIILFSCDDTSRGVLNFLQVVQQLATDTNQDDVAV